MINSKIAALVALLLTTTIFALTGCRSKIEAEPPAERPRVVAIGGAVTEIIYALGAENVLVGTDTSSVYPEAATKLPQVGYQRQLSAEGVISLKPSLVIALPEAGPPPAIQQIESAGIKFLRVNNESTPDGAKAKIRQIAEALNLKEKGEELVKKLETDLAEAEKAVTRRPTRPKVMFIYSRGAGNVQVGGSKTPADAIIKMAGGLNAVTEFSEYKPLTPEATVAAQPDVILLPALGLQTLGGIEAVLGLPGVADTPAGKNRRIVAVDDTLLLGFTPRLGLAVKELCEKIH
jgi:iron complex transport system substrate-binding protein